MPSIHTRSTLLFTTLAAGCCLLWGCLGVQPQIKTQYTLNTYRTKVYGLHHRLPALYVSMPESVQPFETEQMYYITTPYERKAFAHNAWSSAPADMIYPLLVQSLNDTKAFRVVSAGSHSEAFKYRLSTDILKFVQNFSVTPARMQIIISAIVTDTLDGKALASKIFRYQVPCKVSSPYGGAMAANEAIAQFTRDVSEFTVQTIKHRG